VKWVELRLLVRIQGLPDGPLDAVAADVNQSQINCRLKELAKTGFPLSRE